MRIGIIGAGEIGGNLTRRLTELGHEVNVANSRHPLTLGDLVNETGASAVWAADAATDADLVIVSIATKNIPDLPPAIVSRRKPGAPVIDTNNYYPQSRDGYIADIEDGMPESMWVAKNLGAPVFKAFNGMGADYILTGGLPAGSPGRIALPVAGSEGAERDIVFDVIDQLGFDAVYAGPLEESWRQQPDSPVYGKNYDADGVAQALAESTPERSDEFRAKPTS